jgi:hypothetical protein
VTAVEWLRIGAVVVAVIFLVVTFWNTPPRDRWT